MKGGVAHSMPEEQVLAYLMQPQCPLDIARPSVVGLPIGDCPCFSSLLGDALVEQRGELKDRLPIDPVVLLEQHCQAIAKAHGGRSKEQCSLLTGEL